MEVNSLSRADRRSSTVRAKTIVSVQQMVGSGLHSSGVKSLDGVHDPGVADADDSLLRE